MAALSGVLVYQTFTASDGTPFTNMVCRGSLVNTPYSDDTNLYVNKEGAVQYKTDSNGLVQWIFPAGSIIHVTARDADLEYVKQVPVSGISSIQLTSMADA